MRAARFQPPLARVAVPLVALLSGCAINPAAIEREALQTELGRDPVELLRAIGNAPDVERAEAAASELRVGLTARQELRLLRFGLGSNDERTVFGATVLMNRYDRLAVPEMRNAARIVVPRIGDADCPV
jgi:hypothetical protein